MPSARAKGQLTPSASLVSGYRINDTDTAPKVRYRPAPPPDPPPQFVSKVPREKGSQAPDETPATDVQTPDVNTLSLKITKFAMLLKGHWVKGVYCRCIRN